MDESISESSAWQLAVAQAIEVLVNGGAGMWVHVAKISRAGALPSDTFDLPGHEWHRVTDTVR